MSELIRDIYQALAQSNIDVYRRKAPSDAQYPYAVFKLPTTTSYSDREDYILEVDIWDNENAWTQVEDIERITEITSNIDKAISKLQILNDTHLLIFQKINQLEIPDPDDSIRRNQLRYVIKRSERVV
jgi:hypothetical protein